MNIIIWDYESIWTKVWSQNKYRSLWPIFHGPVILCYILTIWYMNIILWDYGSVWPDVWPQNKCRSMWLIFHGPVILSCISRTIWCMSVIFSNNETVWPKLWPQSKYKSTWPIFHGLVILLNIFQDYLMDEHHSRYNGSLSVTHRLTLPSICRSVTYILWSSDFASYLEDYLMENYCNWDNRSMWHKDRPSKIYMGQWPIFHGPLILPYIIVIELNYFYTLWNGAGRGYSCPSGHLL